MITIIAIAVGSTLIGDLLDKYDRTIGEMIKALGVAIILILMFPFIIHLFQIIKTVL